MIYLIMSSTGGYQLNSFKPHLVTQFSTNLLEIIEEKLRPYGGKPSSSIEERIAMLTRIHDNRRSFTYIEVPSPADLPKSHPELFV